MPTWFRKGLSPHQTALAMIGAKSGDRVIVIGATHPDLCAELALVTGLNGSTTVFEESADARGRVEAAARQAGALVDFEQAAARALPVSNDSTDISVLMISLGSREVDQRLELVQEALRVLRSGGRLIVIDGSRSSGVFRALQEKPPRLAADDVLGLLDRAGTKARRQLADVDRVAFYEARKA